MRWLARLLAAASIVLGLASVADARDGVALIIGSNDYQFAPKLKNARSDAERIAGVMRKLGYQVIEAYDADEHSMAEAMDAFASAVKTARIGLVYYAGHGIQYQGKVYLVPVDLNLGNERDLRKTIPAEYLVSDAATASELGIVILDACRDNPFVKQIAEDVGPTRSMSVSRGLRRIDAAPAKSLIAYATQEGNVALDGDSGNSPYAQSLADHLATPNRDIRLIFGAVRDDVVKVTGGKQEPYIYGSLGGDEIFLSRTGSGTENAPAGSSLASIEFPNIGNLASVPPDYAAWKDALAADEWQGLGQFASAYPDSLYGAVARLLLARKAAYPRPSEAFAAETSVSVALTKLPKQSLAAVQTALRDLDYGSGAISGVADARTTAALAAFAESEGGTPAFTIGAIAGLADRAATRGAGSALTGSWKGRYEYPDGRRGVDFTQDLTFSQGLVTGYLSEPNTFGDKSSKNLYATLNGAVSGNEIEWLKTYDGTAGVSHSVKYHGKLDRADRKIVGKWEIVGALSGTFELTRQ